MVSKQKAKENLIGEEISSHSLDQNQRNTYIHTYIHIYIYNTHIYINTYTISTLWNVALFFLFSEMQRQTHYKYNSNKNNITSLQRYVN